MTLQAGLFADDQRLPYRPILTAMENRKGVLDVDTVKGCHAGMSAYPGTGCYGACYAKTTAKQYGRDFTVSVSRVPGINSWREVWYKVRDHAFNWYRIGTAGDPSSDWDNTLSVCELLQSTGKHPVIITKHWKVISDENMDRLLSVSAVINTSVSALDTPAELKHRLFQIERVRASGIKSVARVVTCRFGETEWAKGRAVIQGQLLQLRPIVDNPLRIQKTDQRVIDGHLVVENIPHAVGGGKSVSLHRHDVYLGKCEGCIDQCGAHTRKG